MFNIPQCKIVAEACCNHLGDMNIAKEMIKAAATCGADYIKFQKRNCNKAVPKHIQDKPHPYPENSFGDTYLKHRQSLEFSIEQHKELIETCDKEGIRYACSVWDEDSAAEIISLKPDYIKIPSAMNGNIKLINIVLRDYNGKIHLSLGMMSRKEREKLLYQQLKDVHDRIIPYWTTSDYPVKFNELYLLEIQKLRKGFETIGFSGHHLGIAVDMCAVAFGAQWIERHFTLDRTWKGSDQAASLETAGLAKLVRDVKAVQAAMQYKGDGITAGEKHNRDKLRLETK